MPAGYSGTPLARKLGFKPCIEACILGAPAGYRGLLEPLPEGVRFAARPGKNTVLLQVFTSSRAHLERTLARLRKSLRPDAALWVSWPKQASKLPTDVNENEIRAVALPLGFIDIKVCAVDQTWSGLKLVIRKQLRGK